MAAKPRVHEVASEMGVDSKVALKVLHSHGEFVKGPSSSIEPPVVAVQAHPEPKKDAAKWLLGWRIHDGRLEIAQTRFRIYSAVNINQTALLGFEPTTVALCDPSDLGYVLNGQEPAQRLAGMAAAI